MNYAKWSSAGRTPRNRPTCDSSRPEGLSSEAPACYHISAANPLGTVSTIMSYAPTCAELAFPIVSERLSLFTGTPRGR